MPLCLSNIRGKWAIESYWIQFSSENSQWTGCLTHRWVRVWWFDEPWQTVLFPFNVLGTRKGNITWPSVFCCYLYMVVDTRTLFCSDKHSYENNSSNQCTLLKRNIACVALKNLLVSSTPHLLHLQSNNKEGKLIIMN